MEENVKEPTTYMELPKKRYIISIEAEADILEVNNALQLLIEQLGNKVKEYSIVEAI